MCSTRARTAPTARPRKYPPPARKLSVPNTIASVSNSRAYGNDASMPKYAGSVNSMMFIANAVQRPMRLASSRLSGGAATSAPGGPRE